MYTNFSPCFYLWNRSSNEIWRAYTHDEYINILYYNKRVTRVQFPDKKIVGRTIEQDTHHFANIVYALYNFRKIWTSNKRRDEHVPPYYQHGGTRSMDDVINVRVSIRPFRDDFLSLHEVYARSQHVFTISGIENRLPDTSFTSRVNRRQTCIGCVEIWWKKKYVKFNYLNIFKYNFR